MESARARRSAGARPDDQMPPLQATCSTFCAHQGRVTGEDGRYGGLIMWLNAVNWITPFLGVLTLLFAVVATVLTTIYVVLTRRLLVETREMRRFQTEPLLELTVESTEAAINFIRLHLRNVGPAAARDLKLAITPVAGGAMAQKILEDFSTTAFITKGLRYLGPNQERYSGPTNSRQWSEQKFECSFEIVLTYRKPNGKTVEELHIVDLGDFKGNYRLGPTTIEKIEKHLEVLSEDFHKVFGNSGRVGVDVFTAEERSLEEVEQIRATNAARRGEGS